MPGGEAEDIEKEANTSAEDVKSIDPAEEPKGHRKRRSEAEGGNKRKPPKRQRFDEADEEDPMMPVGFRIVDGIRYLDPYWSVWRTYAKGRWLGRKLVDCFAQEFLSCNKHYSTVAVKLGRVYVNGKQITDTEYVLQNADFIEHWGHRHEHPVLDCKIRIVEDNENLLVVDKPASLPVHACGQYSIHTVLGLLRTQHQITGLRVLHRLDRTTSGLLLFAKNYATDLDFKQTLKLGHWVKEYVCKVDGVFPEEEIVCEEPLGNLVVSMGIQCVRADGKDARSRFKRMWTDGKVSVVKVTIDTGRTHQIRVHAQFLGHPIVGDTIYNSTVWGPERGKGADYRKGFDQLAIDVRDNHKMTNWLEEIAPGYDEMMEKMAFGEVTAEPPFIPREERPTYDPVCLGCNVVKKAPTMAHFSLNLHCLRYETENWSYQTDLPDWAIQPEA